MEAETNHGVITNNTALLEAVNKSFACKSKRLLNQFSFKKKESKEYFIFHLG